MKTIKTKAFLDTKSSKGTLKVIKTCRFGNKINVTVRLFQTPQTSPKFFNPNLNKSSRNLKFIFNTPLTGFVDINNLKQSSNPNDFIEPIQNLAIPSTQEYMMHVKDNRPVQTPLAFGKIYLEKNEQKTKKKFVSLAPKHAKKTLKKIDKY
jgi:hypothetical protein